MIPMSWQIWWERRCARVLSRHCSGRLVNAFIGSANVGQFREGKEV